MLALLSNNRRVIGCLVMLMALGLAGCSDPEIDRVGTWKPVGINDQNLRAMLVTPQDLYSGAATTTTRADAGSRAVSRLLTDHRRPLLDASVSHIGGGAGAAADTPAPAPGGGGSSGSAQ